MIEFTPDFIAAFYARTEPGPNGCLLWTGPTNNNGYGRVSVNVGEKRSRTMYAHRVAWSMQTGESLDRVLQLDHVKERCRSRRCVNVAHLEPVTGAENTRRGGSFAGRNARKQACPKGHPYDAENTMLTADGFRRCRTCVFQQQMARAR